MSTTQAQFLARIRGALGGATQGAPTPPKVDDALIRLAGPGDDLVAMFTQRAGKVGMFVHPVERATLTDMVIGLLRGKRRVVLSGVERYGLSEPMTAAGFELLDPAAGLDPQYDADAGVTDVAAALAETGTLVITSDRRSRGPSLIPPHHLAIVRHDDLLPDLLDYMARLGGLPPEDLPASQAFITGPSKTADIEGMLITGVHGPGRVDILLLHP